MNVKLTIDELRIAHAVGRDIARGGDGFISLSDGAATVLSGGDPAKYSLVLDAIDAAYLDERELQVDGEIRRRRAIVPAS